MLKKVIFFLIGTGVFWGQTSILANNVAVVNQYIDDFSTETARVDCIDADLFWVDKAYPPPSPCLVYTQWNGDPVLAFRGYENQPARLAYSFPIGPDLAVREASWIIEVQVDVKLTTSRDPTNPVSGYLAYQISADGVNWSDPRVLSHGRNTLELGQGLLKNNRYIEFIGSNAQLNSLEVTIYQPEAILRVGPGQIDTIQGAIGAAQDGYIIVVDDGTYSGPGNTDVNFMGKDIVLMSANGPESCIIACNGVSQGVSFIMGETKDAVLDGFTIQAGLAAQGAGIYCDGADPTISNCIIADCLAQDMSGPGKGAGLYIESGYPTIKNCQFRNNQAAGSDARGGAIYIGTEAAAVMTGCLFEDNQVDQGMGGAIHAESTSLSDALVLQNCIFNANRSQEYGGGVSLLRGLSSIVNCTFVNNQATVSGGAVYYSSADNTNQASIHNSILWQNLPERDDIAITDVGPDVRYNNLSENTFGDDNLSLDPGFVDEENGDFHLQSNAGRWSSPQGQWVFDQDTSPCIDAGDPESALGAERWPHGDAINMGAYGGTAQASLGGGIRVFHVDIEHGSDANNGLDSTHAVASINTAVSLAQDGDYILVWPGKYQEEVILEDKAITIQSAADAAIVTAPEEGFAFSFFQQEGSGSVLRNMIIADCKQGGIFMQLAAPTIHNLTIVNNPVGIDAVENAVPDIRNCIFWNNWDDDVVGASAHYSVLSFDEDNKGEGNLYSQNPLFADFVNGDYHLRSQYGRYWPEHGVWVVDTETSPCLDVGEPAVYPVEEPHYNGGRLNIGAHGGTGYASISAPDKPTDLNNDGLVDFLDFALLAEDWLKP